MTSNAPKDAPLRPTWPDSGCSSYAGMNRIKFAGLDLSTLTRTPRSACIVAPLLKRASSRPWTTALTPPILRSGCQLSVGNARSAPRTADVPRASDAERRRKTVSDRSGECSLSSCSRDVAAVVGNRTSASRFADRLYDRKWPKAGAQGARVGPKDSYRQVT